MSDAMNTTMDFLQRSIHPDDWDVFWDVAKTNRQRTQDLLEVAMTITEKIAAFPTGRPSDSSNGRPVTDTKSSEGSPSLTTRALDILPGRPDLQSAVVRAQEAIAA